MVYKPITTLKAMTIPEAKGALDKKWTKLQKLQAWDESVETSNAEVIRKAILGGKKSSLWNNNGLDSSQEL